MRFEPLIKTAATGRLSRALILASFPNNLARLLRVISSLILYWPHCQACCVRHINMLDDKIPIYESCYPPAFIV